MVRKRAPAQKGLSPYKTSKDDVTSGRKRKNSKISGSEKDSNEGEPSFESEDSVILNGTTEMIEDTNDDTLELTEELYNELPDFNEFSKELSDKTKTYWGTVITDYTNFTNWTCLLQTVTETEDNLEAARAVYNCFLRYYPYCYGYWKKFADIEKKSGNFEKAKEVFQRGVQAIPVSIDLWVHYLNFTIQQCKGKENSQNEIRKLFDEAIETAGMEFKSNKLWDAHIEWEKSLGNTRRVTQIYDMLISTPTQHYMKNWQKFKEHLEKYSLAEVLPTEEYSKIMQQVDAIPPGMASDDDPSIITTEPPGEGDAKSFTKAENESFSVIEENMDTEKREKIDPVKKKVIAERESIFVETAGEIKKRWKYEDAIKRPYFHVKPLEKAQLKNWQEYIDYEIRQGGHKRVCFLFERCMVACALYEDFWQKYIDYIESRDADKARHVYSRACNIHLLKKHKINLHWATFEEKQMNHKAASRILCNIDNNFPGMILITQRRVGLARRMHRLNDIVNIYENVIEKSERIEDKIFYSIKFSHVLAKFCNKKDQARDILWKALELGKKHKRLYLQLLDLEMHYGTVENEFVYKLFSAVENDMSLNDDFRDLFSLRKVEFYEEYCDDITEILHVKDSYKIDHKKRESVKRMLSSSSLETPAKLAKTDDQSSGAASSVATPTNETYSQDNPWYHAANAEGAANYYGNWGNYATQYANYNQQQQQE